MKNKKYVKPNENPNIVGNIAIIFTSIIMILLGLVLIMCQQVKMVYFCYGAGGCLLLWGIWLISRYFLRREFQQTTNYGFSFGVLLVILGAVSLIRSKEIAATIPNYMGLMVLAMGVVMLQNTVQLKNLEGKTWVLSLIFSMSACFASVMILLDLWKVMSKWPIALYSTLVATGVLSLLSLVFVAIRTSKYHKAVARDLNRHIEEGEEWFDGLKSTNNSTKDNSVNDNADTDEYVENISADETEDSNSDMFEE